jgi:2-succinyl-5-enolpyruvyl-6-hydroxy-3-cyclohexene-1-carboxylate synthase
MHHLQHISDLGPLLKSLGAEHVVIAPGSRNAPLIQLFTSDKAFTCHSIVDERSAGYVALGMAKELNQPVLVLTTSGTAVLNLSPAVAEAFHQQVPLLVLTADRPREIISQFNNQVTDQHFPYFNHSKGFFEFPVQPRTEDQLEESIRSAEKLCLEALREPAGPVHLNLPLSEPLYVPLPEPLLSTGRYASYNKARASEAVSNHELVPGRISPAKKIMILAGMGRKDAALEQVLEELLACRQAVVVAENISNKSSGLFISTPELVLAGALEEELKALTPDILITFGLQVVSKRLKLFLQLLTDLEIVELQDSAALPELLGALLAPEKTENHFLGKWKEIERREAGRASGYLQKASFGSLTALARILQHVPSQTVLHLGNSTTVRFSQVLQARSDLLYYSNRGTSGIDGSLSSAVGAAMVSGRQHLLILGDLSFVYDSNGLWNKDFPENLKIVVMNDGGGGIFRLLDGPDQMDFFEEFSVTHHPVSLELLSGAFGRRFARATGMEELEREIAKLCSNGSGLSVLEVDTAGSENSRIFKALYSK